MHDPFPLFKVLIVVLVVVYQGVQALRKRAAKQGDAHNAPPSEDFPPEDDATLFPYPAPSQPDPEIPLRTEQRPVSAPVQLPDPVRSVAPKAESLVNLLALSENRGATSQAVPSLRNLILAQVILSPPPGLREIPRKRETPPVGFRR